MEFRLARRSSATAGESEHTSWSVVSSHVVDVLTRPAILLASFPEHRSWIGNDGVLIKGQ